MDLWAAICGRWDGTLSRLRRPSAEGGRGKGRRRDHAVSWRVAASGSKAGSRYRFSVASTYEEFCPTLKEKLGERSRVPPGVSSIMEIIINGARSGNDFSGATQAAIAASVDTPGLLKISAGNYGGRLGKNFIYLRPKVTS